MQIVYDDIIYNLQRSGGLSLYWSQLETYLEQNTHQIMKWVVIYKVC
jgi:hypothetical protein